jgi:hypothetical protein
LLFPLLSPWPDSSLDWDLESQGERMRQQGSRYLYVNSSSITREPPQRWRPPLVDDSVQALVAGVREQQDSLLAAWQGENAGTEELRAAVQHYRAFGDRLADFTREI